nr:MAG TPA: hypothetical protein [Caudoviricetes sp.]
MQKDNTKPDPDDLFVRVKLLCGSAICIIARLVNLCNTKFDCGRKRKPPRCVSIKAAAGRKCASSFIFSPVR